MYENDLSKQVNLYDSVTESASYPERYNSITGQKKRWIPMLLLVSISMLFSGFAHSSEEDDSQVRQFNSSHLDEKSNNSKLLIAENGVAEDGSGAILLTKAVNMDLTNANIHVAATNFQVKTDAAVKTDRLGSGLNNSSPVSDNMVATSVIMVVLGLLSLVWVARRA